MSKSVALFGETLADIFPDRSVLGGAPFNVARHLQVFGLQPIMTTRIGNDGLGRELLNDMSRLGLDQSGVQRDSIYPTGQVRIHLENTGHRFEILPDQAYDHICPDELIKTDTPPDIVYFGTLAQRCPESRLALDVFLANSQSPRFVDINLRHPWYDLNIIERSLELADILKINDEELAIVAGLLNLSGSAEQQAAALTDNFGLECVIVTCGACGAWLLQGSKEVIRVPGKPPATLADTVGAGDGFAAVYLLGRLHQWPTEITLNRANDFAAAICTVRGAVGGKVFYTPFKLEWKL